MGVTGQFWRVSLFDPGFFGQHGFVCVSLFRDSVENSASVLSLNEGTVTGATQHEESQPFVNLVTTPRIDELPMPPSDWTLVLVTV